MKWNRMLVRQLSVAIAMGGIAWSYGAVASASDASNHDITVREDGYTIDGVQYDGVYDDGIDSLDTDKSIRTSDGNATNNKVTVKSGTHGLIHGGFAYSEKEASGNTVHIEGGTVSHVHGGHSDGNANNNTITIDLGLITDLIGAGLSTGDGDASNNTLNINGGEVDGGTADGQNMGRGIYGGLAMGAGNADGNEVNISGGTVIGDVYGGWAPNGSASNNTINIYGNPDLTQANLYAGNAATTSNNVLNIRTTGADGQGVTVNDIGGFDKLNFYLPNDISSGDKFLIINSESSSSLDGTYINAIGDGGAKFTTGDSFDLLTANKFNLDGFNNYNTSGILSKGVSKDYVLSLTTSGNKLTATVGEEKGGGLKPETEILPRAVRAGVNLVDHGMDNSLNEWQDLLDPGEEENFAGENSDVGGDQLDIKHNYQIFMAMGGGLMHTRQSGGGSLDTKYGGLNIGTARMIERGANKFYWAPIFDYNISRYDTYLGDGMHGSGHSKYMAGGLIFHNKNKSGLYYEGSLRFGRVKTTFESSDFLINNEPAYSSYSASAPAMAGHLRLGKIYKLDPRNYLDVYGAYYHSHVGSMKAQLSTGENYFFDSINNGRVRVGFRFTKIKDKYSRFYSGLAYQYDRVDDAIGTFDGDRIVDNGKSGSSGMLELGWLYRPVKSPLMLNVKLTGWIGMHRGLNISAKFERAI